ncbi:DnaB-like helicase C-terminal domain-containing protein [Streptomyces sp. 5-10]|uniref:DnaB-like helicase C-terminal domain-containing protein n=1 Tax=Streptomyces sp. 5-10 TaxID=878925 RepID=UPI00168AB3A9|nr:DnaB-like helicase C-terminal domain-containing protein [Streptomyces sp. 5-10]MBD3004701.1 hypothetical protein [Streptomyces sp. 5-10]
MPETKMIRTGIRALDETAGALLPGQVILIGYRSGADGDSVAHAIAHHVGLKQGVKTILFDVELPHEEAMRRLAAMEPGPLPPSGDAAGADRPTDTRARLLGGALTVAEGRWHEMSDLRPAIEPDTQVVVLNAARLLEGFGGESLRWLASESGACVVATVRLNHQADGRAATLMDLPGGSSLAQGVDTVILPGRRTRHGEVNFELAKSRSNSVTLSLH